MVFAGTTDRRLACRRIAELYGPTEDLLVAAEKVADLEAELAAWEVACEQEQADLDTVLGRQRELQARVDEACQLMAEAGHLQAVQARLTAANEKFAALNIQGVLARQDGRLRESRLQADRNADLVVRLATALPTPVPAPAAALRTVEAVAAVEAKPLMSSLADGYFQHRQEVAQATHQVMNQDRGTLRRFVEVCGDRPVNTYRRADVTVFLAKLRQLPAVYGRSAADREASFADLIARAQASGCETLSEKTVKRHLSALPNFSASALTRATWALSPGWKCSTSTS